MPRYLDRPSGKRRFFTLKLVKLRQTFVVHRPQFAVYGKAAGFIGNEPCVVSEIDDAIERIRRDLSDKPLTRQQMIILTTAHQTAVKEEKHLSS